MSYSERLKDPRWQRRRLEILSRADFSCEDCGARDKTLHVHHKLYRRGAAPWEYEDRELISLCEDCHGARHELQSTLEAWLANLKVTELVRVLGYVKTLTLLMDGRTSDISVPIAEEPEVTGAVDALSATAGLGHEIEDKLHSALKSADGHLQIEAAAIIGTERRS